MNDQRVVGLFAGALQNYMMNLERRVSALEDAPAVTADTPSNYAFVSDTAGLDTTSSTYVDVPGLTTEITTTGGALLIVMAGGRISNLDFQEFTHLGVNVDGTDYTLCSFYQDITADTDDVSVPYGGVRVVAGLAAGTYTITGRLMSGAGGTARLSSTSDSVHNLFVMELA